MTTRTASGSTYTLGYDYENHLTSVSGAATAGFVYDGDGKRVKETNAYKNLAQGIVVTGSVAVTNPDVITNGDTQADNGAGTSREYGYSSANGLQYVEIDLGALFPVNKVIVWHYNGGTRTYHNTKTQVSADRVTWTTVFDSAVSGEYVETLAGKTHTFTQRSVRYVRDYLNGSTANSGNHWTEIEVWGTATTAYVGDYFEWNGSVETMTRYYSAGGTRVAVRNSNGNGTDGLVYLLGDHLGSASLTADPLDGDKLSELRYKAWGETRHTLTNAPTDRRYTGQTSEEAGIGLYYYGARFYDSALGRFVSPDSIIPQNQGTQAWDHYAYANNNPIRYNDPTGHWIESLLDIASIAYDVYDISQNGLNWGSGLSLAADVAGLILPGVTGLGMAARALSKVDDVGDAARAVNTASNIGQTANQADSALDVLSHTDDVPGSEVLYQYSRRPGP